MATVQLRRRLAVAAAAAFLMPPLLAASQTPSALTLTHRFLPGERFVYDAKTIITSAQLKSKRPGRYTLDVDAHDPSRAVLRIDHDGKPGSPIAITIKPDGTWTRADGRAVPGFVSYDPSRMCKHADGDVRVGEAWDCRAEGVVQYLGSVPAEPGDVHVSVVKVVPPSTVELSIAFKGQATRTTMLDEATRNEVQVGQQTVRMSDVVFENGIVTSIAEHSQIGTTVAGSTSVMDVVATKNLVEHRPR